jgi:hypothetical protein
MELVCLAWLVLAGNGSSYLTRDALWTNGKNKEQNELDNVSQCPLQSLSGPLTEIKRKRKKIHGTRHAR